MRVLVVSTDPGVPWSGGKGASVHLREISRALVEEGSEVLALVSGESRAYPPAPSSPAVEPLDSGETAAQRLANAPSTAATILASIRGFRADAVYERFAPHTGAASAAARMAGTPHLVELNAPLSDETARHRRLDHPEAARRLERLVLHEAAVVFAVSPPLARYATARGARRTEVLPNAVAADRFPRLAPQRQLRPVAIFAGRVKPWHGIEQLARSWQIFGRRAFRLRVLGDPGDARTLLALAGAELVGPVDYGEVPGLLCDADIGLAPYAPGAPDYFSPLKVFDYMAAGLAIVASDLPGVREATGPDGAVLVDPSDSAGLAEAARRLAYDRDRRLAIGAAARARVLERHTWRHRARQVLAEVSRAAEVGA